MPPDRRAASSVGGSSVNGSNDGDTSKPAKRRYAKANRSLRACDTCHGRKTRCSGQQPCKFCLSRGLECIMSDDNARAQLPRAGTSRSQERADLRQSIEHRHSQKSASPNPAQLPVPTRAHSATPLAQYAANAQLPLPTPPPPPFVHTAQARSPSASAYYGEAAPEINSPPRKLSESSDKLVAVEPLSREADFVAGIPVRTPQSTSGPVYFFDGFIFTRFQRPQRYIQEADITVMLTKEKSNRYLDLYFSEAECIYQLWPVPSIIQHCHDVIWGEIPAEQFPKTALSLGLRSTLTVLLAFGALLDHEITDSEMLYHAARSCYLDIIDLASLESVQLALQLAIFEMNSRRASSVPNTLAVGIRSAQCMNLHRKDNLTGLPPEEVLRRSQLWHTCFVQDCWLSMATGRPPLICEEDCDIEIPIYGPDPYPAPAFVSPFLPSLVRLSDIWCSAHAKFLRTNGSTTMELQRTESLSFIDTELRIWQRDIHQLYARLSTILSRSERLHCQAVLLTFSSMRLTIHRAHLRILQAVGDQYQQSDLQHRLISQNTVLDAAIDIAAYAKASLQLGMRQCFSFLGTSLYIAHLALWEHLQSKKLPARTNEENRAEEGLKNIVWLVESAAQNAENPAMFEVLTAVRQTQRVLARPTVVVEEPVLPSAPFQQTYTDRRHSSAPDRIALQYSDTIRNHQGSMSHQYLHSDREHPFTPRASTSSQPYIPRNIDARTSSHASWAVGLPSKRSHEGTSPYRAQQPRETSDRWQP